MDRWKRTLKGKFRNPRDEPASAFPPRPVLCPWGNTFSTDRWKLQTVVGGRNGIAGAEKPQSHFGANLCIPKELCPNPVQDFCCLFPSFKRGHKAFTFPFSVPPEDRYLTPPCAGEETEFVV